MKRVGKARTRHANVRGDFRDEPELEKSPQGRTFPGTICITASMSFAVPIPPLRERPGDLLKIAERCYLQFFSRQSPANNSREFSRRGGSGPATLCLAGQPARIAQCR